MNYKETVEFLYNIPMFEKQGKSGYKEGLGNTTALDDHFGHPHRNYRTIHVAGTNGKGSVSHTLAAILQSAGYKVGLYTSPHLASFRERIRIDGKMIPEDYVVDFVMTNRSLIESINPSFFEVVTAMAFKFFSDEKIDIAVIEVGLGGRLDCTNIITPVLSVITNISFDHTQFLGDTLAKIASEKAGIIKHGIPAVIGEADDETRPVFTAKAEDAESPIYFAEDDRQIISSEDTPSGGRLYHTRDYGEIEGQLGGLYQDKNTNTILKACKILSDVGILGDISATPDPSPALLQIKEGIRNVGSLTGLTGRWQILREHPRVICDTGHNVGGWIYLSKQIKALKCDKLHIVFGMVDDKDVEGVMEMLPEDAVYYFTKASSKRAISEKRMKELGLKHNLKGEAFGSVRKAYETALRAATEKDIVFVGGSSYVVADLLSECI